MVLTARSNFKYTGPIVLANCTSQHETFGGSYNMLSSMRLPRRELTHRYFLVVMVLLGAAAVAQAGTILDTGTALSLTSRTSAEGPGQGVAVSVSTTVTQFGFYLDTPSGGNLEFMIWNGTNSTLLFSQIDSAATTSSPALVLTAPMSFSLLAGSTYYFAVIPDTAANIEYFSSPISLSQNGLSLVNPNTNYGPYSAPVFIGSAGATIALQIDGTTAAVPEPATWFSAVLGLGLLSLAGRSWSRRG